MLGFGSKQSLQEQSTPACFIGPIYSMVVMVSTIPPPSSHPRPTRYDFWLPHGMNGLIILWSYLKNINQKVCEVDKS